MKECGDHRMSEKQLNKFLLKSRLQVQTNTPIKNNKQVYSSQPFPATIPVAYFWLEGKTNNNLHFQIRQMPLIAETVRHTGEGEK